MILPQYSLRKLLTIVVGFALFCLLVSWGVRGSSWALGIALAGLSIAVALLIQGAMFWFVWLFATLADHRRARQGARIARTKLRTVSTVEVQTSKNGDE